MAYILSSCMGYDTVISYGTPYYRNGIVEYYFYNGYYYYPRYHNNRTYYVKRSRPFINRRKPRYKVMPKHKRSHKANKYYHRH